MFGPNRKKTYLKIHSDVKFDLAVKIQVKLNFFRLGKHILMATNRKLYEESNIDARFHPKINVPKDKVKHK